MQSACSLDKVTGTPFQGLTDVPRCERGSVADSVTSRPGSDYVLEADVTPVLRPRPQGHQAEPPGNAGSGRAPGGSPSPGLYTHLRQGPPVHVGTTQVDVPSVHDPEFGVQNAPGELPHGHEPYLGPWQGGQDRVVSWPLVGALFAGSLILRYLQLGRRVYPRSSRLSPCHHRPHFPGGATEASTGPGSLRAAPLRSSGL